MSTDNFPFSVAQQKALISAGLHSTLLAQFLFGIYTGLFPVALYVYTHKENRTQSRDRIIIGVITALYSSMALFLLSNWLFTSIIFCKTVETRVDMFMESITGAMPSGQRVLGVVSAFVVFLFADGLLTTNESGVEKLSRMWAVLSQIFTANCASCGGDSLVYNGLIDAKPSFETIQTDRITNRLTAAALTSVAATSLVSTAVICRQIWQHTSPNSRSRKHYQTIINILIQSSALYTAITLLLAILNFTDTANIASTFTIVLTEVYITAPSQVISGMAPTLMIVALVMSSSQENPEVSSAHIPSDLISCAYQTSANMAYVGADLEMQQSGSMWEGEQESEEIQVVPGNDHGLENDGETRRKTLA